MVGHCATLRAELVRSQKHASQLETQLASSQAELDMVKAGIVPFGLHAEQQLAASESFGEMCTPAYHHRLQEFPAQELAASHTSETIHLATNQAMESEKVPDTDPDMSAARSLVSRLHVLLQSPAAQRSFGTNSLPADLKVSPIMMSPHDQHEKLQYDRPLPLIPSAQKKEHTRASQPKPESDFHMHSQRRHGSHMGAPQSPRAA